ncbi:HEPN domain-containing protein [Flagellimonas sp. 389]|uniref:HEPN domain-containing protein n=1 Tax=Flagellimonas sp. 389 TaxID=2835862 RepID=UPI001BD6AB9F|nr:HEPN domain-containing protein [Flagellimonas sp. 389]MBS9461002.1 HEPN domain-containing protein [Flagellimonas sp. 389]
MTHGTNIPENFERAEELSNLLDGILNIITIDRVFLSRPQKEGDIEYHIITLFVDVNNDPLPNEIRSLVTKKGKEHPDFRIRIYTENQSEIGLERGSLYFLEHCCLGENIFAHPEGENIMDYSEIVHKTLIYRATRYFDSEMGKIKAFANTANILIGEGNHAIATFNMHQAFELAFRFIEQMCIGKSKVTHSIISHINYCMPFFPTLHPFSETSKMDNNELLLLLEHAYSVARYGSEFEITKNQAKTIQTELIGFIQEVQSIFQRHLAYCKERIEGKEPDTRDETLPEKNNENDGQGKSLLEKLKDLKEEHFYTLKPYSPERGTYSIDLLTDGYLDTSFMITNLIKVCITALEVENFPNRSVQQPEHNVREVLGYVLDLVPHEEMEFLDKIGKLLSEQQTSTTD